jgi:DNA-binding HxlR family transcriptional regulator
LKALAASGLIDRRDFGVVPPKVEYRLTRKGQSFVPVVAVIRDWGERHLGEQASRAEAAE